MKLLIVIFSATIAVSRNVVESNDSLSEAYIKTAGEELLKQVRSIKEEIKHIQDGISNAITVKLKQTQEFINVGNLFIGGLIRRTMSMHCAVTVDKNYIKYLETVTSELLKEALKNITDNEYNFITIQKELNFLETTLETNLDQEVKKCINDTKACNITGKFTQMIEKLFRLVDLIKHKMMNVTENQVSPKDIQNMIKTYMAQVPKCLIEQKKSNQ